MKYETKDNTTFCVLDLVEDIAMRVNKLDLCEALDVDVQSIHKMKADALINYRDSIEEVILPQPDLKILGIKCTFGDVAVPTIKRKSELPNLASPW